MKGEFAQLQAICFRQAEVVIVAADIRDEGPLKDCRDYKAAQARLAEVTLGVMDNYAKALLALANGSSFELSSDIEGVGAKLAGLKTKDGKGLVDKAEVTAITKIVEILCRRCHIGAT